MHLPQPSQKHRTLNSQQSNTGQPSLPDAVLWKVLPRGGANHRGRPEPDPPIDDEPSAPSLLTSTQLLLVIRRKYFYACHSKSSQQINWFHLQHSSTSQSWAACRERKVENFGPLPSDLPRTRKNNPRPINNSQQEVCAKLLQEYHSHWHSCGALDTGPSSTTSQQQREENPPHYLRQPLRKRNE